MNAYRSECPINLTLEMLGDGKRLFGPGLPKVSLELIQARPLDVGSVILRYRLKRMT